MNSLIIILCSMVFVQALLAYFVYNKLALLKSFKLYGVGIKHLYIAALLLAPLIVIFFVGVLFFTLVHSLFTKKKVKVAKPYTVQTDIDDFLKEFGGGR